MGFGVTTIQAQLSPFLFSPFFFFHLESACYLESACLSQLFHAINEIGAGTLASKPVVVWGRVCVCKALQLVKCLFYGASTIILLH